MAVANIADTPQRAAFTPDPTAWPIPAPGVFHILEDSGAERHVPYTREAASVDEGIPAASTRVYVFSES